MKTKKKKYLKIIFSPLLFLSSLFVLSMIFSFIFPEEGIISKSLRLPLQKKVMASIGDYTIKNQQIIKYINEENLIIDGENNISLSDLNNYFSKLQTGDILFTNSGQYLSSVFIPGKWKHSAIYIGSKEQLINFSGKNSNLFKSLEKYYENEKQILILDSSSEGVKIRNIESLSNLAESSYLKSLSVFRIKKDKEKIIKFLEKSKNQIGKEYDYDLITESDQELYCSELIYHSLKEIGFKINKKNSISRKLISPDDLNNYMLNNKSFTFVIFLEKENGFIKELNKLELLKESSIY